MKKTTVFLPALFCAGVLFAQDAPSYKFGNVTAEDLRKTVYSVDSNASAVIIADIGKSSIVGNAGGGIWLEHTHFKRVHVLKKSGYPIADVEIPLYVNGSNEEKIKSIKAVTYNLEDGKLVESKLEKAGIFTDKYSKNFIVKKFTFPNLKEGSVIEFEYTLTSDFLFNLQPWAFQGKDAPRLWSEYRVEYPDFLDYIMLSKGYHPYFISETKPSKSTFPITQSSGTGAAGYYTINSGVTSRHWVMKDVPELKKENFTSTLSNHIAKIEFQFSGYKYPLVPRRSISNWGEFVRGLMENDYFGKSLTAANNWMSDDIKLITAGASSGEEKARKIFAYVRDNITCTDHDARSGSQLLKNVLKSKKGNVADINLLLTAMLRDIHIAADPVILSTRDHGVTYPLYPIISEYNYVVCRAVIDGKEYYLDASTPRMGFGKLPSECYNSTARLINESAWAIEKLKADSLKESKLTSVILINDEKGKWVGHMNQTLGYYESCNARDKIKEAGEEEYTKMLQKAYGNELTMGKMVYDSLNNYDHPVGIQSDFTMNNTSDDIIYFNPMFAEGKKENPFKSAERLYPVEMPYTKIETFVLTLDVPNGYVADELPKSIKVMLNQKGEGEFEYLVTQSGEIISMRSRLKFTRATFLPEEYELLREFYNLVVNKHNEQIVFKKKK